VLLKILSKVMERRVDLKKEWVRGYRGKLTNFKERGGKT
jgi:hypothetical protein